VKNFRLLTMKFLSSWPVTNWTLALAPEPSQITHFIRTQVLIYIIVRGFIMDSKFSLA